VSASSPLFRPAGGLDVSALTQPVDESALSGFIAESKATGRPWSRMTTGLPRPGASDIIEQLMPFVIPLIGLTFLLFAGGASMLRAVFSFSFEAPFPWNLIVVGFFGLVLLGVVGAGVRVIKTIRSLSIPRWWWDAAYRITRFAAANQLAYGHDEVVAYPGVIFGTGTDPVAERRLTTTAGRRVEIGNYRYTITGENRDDARVYGWGYVCITLDRRLPHLLLDAKANDSSVFGIRTSNLPVDLAHDQRLSLGGEFDDKFTLYAPSDYGRDAFYIFAPDLMALFIDRLGTFDVEIIDDTMFVYGGRFDLLDPRTYAWLQELVDTVVARTVRRTERYNDDFAALEAGPAQRRAAVEPSPMGYPASPTAAPVFALGGDGPPQTAANTVAERGRRLRHNRWGRWSVVGFLIVGFWIYHELAPMFGLPTLGR
jgi:hypothetical protein